MTDTRTALPIGEVDVSVKDSNTLKRERNRRWRARWREYALGLLGNACHGCGETGPLEFDHIVPLRGAPRHQSTEIYTMARHEPSRLLTLFQLLCLRCHREKTRRQNRERKHAQN